MALINCPECNKETSDKAVACPNCGYPIAEYVELSSLKEHECIIEGTVYDLESVLLLRRSGDNNGAVRELREITHDVVYGGDCCSMMNIIDATNAIPKRYELNPKYARTVNQIKCPTCGSTDVNRISSTSRVAGAATFGLFSKTARSQFKCRRCGYKW